MKLTNKEIKIQIALGIITPVVCCNCSEPSYALTKDIIEKYRIWNLEPPERGCYDFCPHCTYHCWLETQDQK